MIYEIFNCVDGKTHGFRFGEARKASTLAALDKVNIPGVVYDALPAPEGFYVLDQRDGIKAGPIADRHQADRFAGMENMASDVNTFRVYQQTLTDAQILTNTQSFT